MEPLRRLSCLWNRRRLEREMAGEMACHRELMSPDRRTNSGDELHLARRRARHLGLDVARSPASGSDLRRPRAPQSAWFYPHGDAGSGSGHRRPVERLSGRADRPSSIRGRFGTRPGFDRASDAPRAWRSCDDPDVSGARASHVVVRDSGPDEPSHRFSVWSPARLAVRLWPVSCGAASRRCPGSMCSIRSHT